MSEPETKFTVIAERGKYRYQAEANTVAGAKAAVDLVMDWLKYPHDVPRKLPLQPGERQ